MDRITLATATSLTLMTMCSVPFADAAGNIEQGAPAQVVKSQSDEQSWTKGDDAEGGLPANNGATQTPPAKHPPTVFMDKAAPTDKTVAEKKKAAGHGPTNVMDRAAPDQKSSDESSKSDAPAK